jgi:hypothetical protein
MVVILPTSYLNTFDVVRQFFAPPSGMEVWRAADLKLSAVPLHVHFLKWSLSNNALT